MFAKEVNEKETRLYVGLSPLAIDRYSNLGHGSLRRSLSLPQTAMSGALNGATIFAIPRIIHD